jgi:hypothetical protein
MKIEIRFFIKIIIFFAVLIVLFFLLSISRVNVKGNNKAVKYFNKGKFELASQIFDDELKKDTKNYVLLSNSAGVDYKLNEFDQAEAKYILVINSTDILKEDKFIALYGMGNVEFKKNNFEKAIDLYKEALKINPNDKDAKYNLEVSLLKLNEKNNQQNNEDDNKNNDKRNDKQKQQEQNLKKQMEENDKAQKENEKKQQEVNNNNTKNDNSSNNSSEKQKKLEKEKKELDKQKQEISDKIKDLMNSKKEEKEPNQKQNSRNKEKTKNNDPEERSEQQELEMKKDENKDMQAAMLLNYYNEVDRNANKLKKQNKKFLGDQDPPQEDW